MNASCIFLDNSNDEYCQLPIKLAFVFQLSYYQQTMVRIHAA